MINAAVNRLIKTPFTGDLVRFICIGAINTLTTIVIYQLMLFLMNYKWAYAVSWLTGLIMVFCLYPRYAFNQSATKISNRVAVILFYLIIFVASYYLLNFLVKCGIKKRLSIFVVVLFSAIVNFLGMRFILSTDNSGLAPLSILEQVSQKIENYLKIEQKTLIQFFTLFAISLFFYFLWLRPLLLSVDSECAFYRMNTGVTKYAWISQGRWAMYLIEHYIFPQQIIPFFPYVIFCFLITISYLIILKAHDIALNAKTYFIFPIFCAFPIWDYIMEFTANLSSTGFGVFLISLATYLLPQDLNAASQTQKSGFSFVQKPSLLIINSLLLAIALGIYQSLLLLFLCFNLGGMILKINSEQEISFSKVIKAFLGVLCVCLLGSFIYFLIGLVMLAIKNQTLSYIQGFWRIELLFTQPFHIFATVFKKFLLLYRGSAKIYGVSIFATGAITLLGFITLVFFGSGKNSPRMLLFNFLSLLILMLLPFGMNFVAGGYMPLRSLLALPYVVWLLTLIACSSKQALMRVLAYGAVTLLNLQILYAFSTYAAIRELRQTHDRLMVHDLYAKIVKLHKNFDSDKKYPIHIQGIKRWYGMYPGAESSVMNESFFNCGEQVLGRVYMFMKILGYPNLEPVNINTYPHLKDYYAGMPSWPDEDCVKVVDGVTIIKLSN